MTYDIIIVGAGSAGCVLAARLSEQSSTRVLLIEAGPPDRNPNIRIPAGFPKLFKTEVDWNYQTTPQSGAGGRSLYMPRGKMLGGCSSMNAMLYVRGHRADFDQWAEMTGDPSWSYEQVLPLFVRSERQERIRNAFHGADGLLGVADQRSPNVLSRAFVDAAIRRGHASNDDFNGAEQEGVGLFQVTQVRGRRSSTSSAFLAPARSRRNLEVMTDTLVERVVFDGSRAVGVEVRRGNETQALTAEREVVVAAGALNSPQLLMRSGIGDATHLAEHGIAVVVDRPSVGRNLQDHLYVSVVYKCNQDITLDTAEEPLRAIPGLANYLVRGRGPFTSCVAEAGGFVRSDAALQAPDLQVLFAPVFFLDHGFERPGGNGFMGGAVLLRPHSAGTVRLGSADPAAPPVIDSAFLTDNRDVAALVTGFRIARDICESAPLAGYAAGRYRPAERIESVDEIVGHLRATSDHLYHPVGTCRMGADEDAVVDSSLRVRGVEGLRVVDASVMPVITRGNTNAPTIMIAERAADLIRGQAVTV